MERNNIIGQFIISLFSFHNRSYTGYRRGQFGYRNGFNNENHRIRRCKGGTQQ